MTQLRVRGWTKELMCLNRNLLCDDCGHPIEEHYFPGSNLELICDVPYCKCSGLQPYSLSKQLDSCGQLNLKFRRRYEKRS